MSVDLNPSQQLVFERPLTQIVKKSLIVANNNAEPVAFKVKTTAPKQYCVRPNSGRIEPGEKIEVSVILQPMKEEPPHGVKCKDKFLVQSAAIPQEKEILSLTEVWAYIEKEAKAKISEQKIRCAYLDPAGDAANLTLDEGDQSVLIDGSPNNLVNGATSPAATRTEFHQADTTFAAADRSPPSVPSFSIPSSGVPKSESTFSSSPTPTSASASLGHLNLGPVGGSTAPTNAAETVATRTGPASSTPTPASSAAPSALEKAQEEIRVLTEKLANAASSSAAATGLRQRGGTGAGTSAADLIGSAQQVVAQQQGVPVEVVAALCLGVFVMTYLFF